MIPPAFQPVVSSVWFCRAVAAKISLMSRQVSSGLACRISAATPATCGDAADVPPKMYWYRFEFSVVTMLRCLRVGSLDGAHTHNDAPSSEYSLLRPAWFTAQTPVTA